MLAVKVEGLSEFERKVRALAEMPDAIARAVNFAAADTVDQMHGALNTEVERVFDRPTGYVKRGLKKRYPTGKARKGFMEPMGADKAGVYYEFFGAGMSPEAVMKPHVYGGPRRRKPFERRLEQVVGAGYHGIMATGYPRNRNGNISGARYTQMLSALNTIETARPGAKRRKAAKTITYYVAKKGGMPVAIMERRGKSVRPMIALTRKRPMYQKRYDFFGVGKRWGQRAFRQQLGQKLFRELNKL